MKPPPHVPPALFPPARIGQPTRWRDHAPFLAVIAFVLVGYCASAAAMLAPGYVAQLPQDPHLGCLTVSEATSLSVSWSALPDQAAKIVAGINSARSKLRSGDIAGARAALEQLEVFAKGHAAALPAWKVSLDLAILTDPVPPVVEPPVEPPVVVEPPTVPPVEPEPEPPIVVPPVEPGQPAGWAPPAFKVQTTKTWTIGQFGGTPDDKAMHLLTSGGGTLTSTEVTGSGGGAGVCLIGDPRPAQSVTVALSNVRLLPYAPGKTKWGARLYATQLSLQRVEVNGIAPEHGIYVNPEGVFTARDVRTRGCGGQSLQLARRNWIQMGVPVPPPYMDQELGAGCTVIDVLGWQAIDHHDPAVPMQNAGALFSIYDQPQAEIRLADVWIEEAKWPCVAALAVAAVDFPNERAAKSLELNGWHLWVREPQQSLFWIYSVPEIRLIGISGKVEGTDLGRAHIRIDPPGIDRPVKATRVLVQGCTIQPPLPIYVGQTFIGTTAEDQDEPGPDLIWGN